MPFTTDPQGTGAGSLAATAPPQPPVLLPSPPSHEEGYANNLTEALRKVAQVEAELRHVKEERDSYQRVAIDAQELSVANILLEVIPGDGSGHEVYAKSVADVEQTLSGMGEQLEQLNNGWRAACKERDTLRDVLTLLAPDLKTMAILYQQQGDTARAQALMNICKSVGAV